MADLQTSIEYLERAIGAMALAVDEGRRPRADRVAIGTRHASPEQKAQWREIAEPLTTCGIADVERRAKRVLGLLTSKPWWKFWA